LAAELDIERRLRWIQSLVAKHSLHGKPDALATFSELRQKIIARQHETRLFLGVVGEFSSGKSTLVNALIRQELLRTDVLQGTTAAITLISYDAEFDVRIRKRQGFLARSTDAVVAGMKTVSGWFAKPAAPPTREQLLLLLHQSTSNEQFAKDILQVNVTLPAKSLAAGVVIVDTPGANATNERHAMVTAAALRDLCDAALVVMPATAAGAESLMDFLRAHAGDVLHRCVFLVTKVDLLRRRQDRDWVLDNLRRRLSSGLGIANPRVLAAAPQFVLESLRRNPVTAPAGFASREEEECYTREEIDEWTCHFESMETELSRLLIDKRLQAQADDIGRTLELIFEHLHASLKINLAGYKQRHEALEAIVIPDIADFILGKCNAHVTRAANAVERIVQPLPYQWREMNSAVLRLLHGHIQRATNRPQLTHAMQTTIPAELARAQTVFRRHLELAMRSASEAAMRELQLFHDEFQSHYRSLATLGGRFDAQSVDWQASTGPLAYSSVSTSRDIAAGLQSLQNDRTNKMLGAGAIGALVGTVLLPGLGTVIGGAIGGFLSTMFGPSLDELKIRVWSELEPAVRPHLDEMSETLLGNVAVASEQLLGELREAILSYRPRYDNLVRQMRQRDNEEKVWLSQVQQSIEADLTAIAAQQLEIANVRHKIRQL
jgi:GTPase Era involved in 16S rRNA processing